MATITLKFDARNTIARKAIDFILTLGVFKVKEEEGNKSMKKAMLDIREGRISKAENTDDLFNKILD
jgi:hypothetical protein